MRLAARPVRLNVPRSKYHARRTELDGQWFDSAAEAAHYAVLVALQQQGDLSSLSRQPRYPLFVGETCLGAYVADFRYRDARGWHVVDVKGLDTPLSRWKRKHVAAQYGLTVEIVQVR